MKLQSDREVHSWQEKIWGQAVVVLLLTVCLLFSGSTAFVAGTENVPAAAEPSFLGAPDVNAVSVAGNELAPDNDIVASSVDSTISSEGNENEAQVPGIPVPEGNCSGDVNTDSKISNESPNGENPEGNNGTVSGEPGTVPGDSTGSGTAGTYGDQPDNGEKGAVNLPQEKTISQTWAGAFRGNPGAGKKLALTFDDGPYPVFTSQYLKVLAEHQVPATFFMVGSRVKCYPEIAKKIPLWGCEVGGHSYGHAKLKGKTGAALEKDFQSTVEVIKSAVGVDLVLFRPPYGAYDNTVLDTAGKFGLTTVNWNVDPRDWETDVSNTIAYRVISRVQEGSIVVLHEGRKGTLEALPRIIKALKKEGYQFVTVSQLMEVGK